jgi:hypothetical protein
MKAALTFLLSARQVGALPVIAICRGGEGGGEEPIPCKDSNKKLDLLYFTLVPRQCWNFSTIYGEWEPSRNRVVVPASQATQPDRIGSLKSIPGPLKSLKIRAQSTNLGQDGCGGHAADA